MIGALLADILRAEGRPYLVMVIFHTHLVARAQGSALVDAAFEIGLGLLTDAEILAHDLAVGVDGGLLGGRQFRRQALEIEAVMQGRRGERGVCGTMREAFMPSG